MQIHVGQQLAAVAIGVASWLTALPAAAITYNFDDGSLGDWQTTTTGGSGSTGVEMHGTPPSMAAFVKHTGAGTHLLSHDFVYDPTHRLQFDMHAVAIPSARNDTAVAGVRITFLNGLNISQGSLALYNATYTLSGGNQFPVDNLPHHYDEMLVDLRSLGGVSAGASVAKVNVTFLSSANTNFFGDVSTASVWADNVTVAVPEPSQAALLLAGLVAGAYVLRRRRRELN